MNLVFDLLHDIKSVDSTALSSTGSNLTWRKLHKLKLLESNSLVGRFASLLLATTANLAWHISSFALSCGVYDAMDESNAQVVFFCPSKMEVWEGYGLVGCCPMAMIQNASLNYRWRMIQLTSREIMWSSCWGFGMPRTKLCSVYPNITRLPLVWEFLTWLTTLLWRGIGYRCLH